ncbi:MAG: phage tail protein [Bacteroidota bacterium]
MMGNRSLTPVGFRFDLTFFDSETSERFTDADGPDACFQTVSGIGVEFESETVQDGANARFVQQLPKRPMFPNLGLKRGFLMESKIFQWFNETLSNSEVAFQPLDVELNLKNEAGESLLNMRFVKAWPKKWSLSDFDAMSSNLVIESLELTYQYFRIIK